MGATCHGGMEEDPLASSVRAAVCVALRWRRSLRLSLRRALRLADALEDEDEPELLSSRDLSSSRPMRSRGAAGLSDAASSATVKSGPSCLAACACCTAG